MARDLPAYTTQNWGQRGEANRKGELRSQQEMLYASEGAFHPLGTATSGRYAPNACASPVEGSEVFAALVHAFNFLCET